MTLVRLELPIVVIDAEVVFVWMFLVQLLSDPRTAAASDATVDYLVGRLQVVISTQDGQGTTHCLTDASSFVSGCRTESHHQLAIVILASLHLSI